MGQAGVAHEKAVPRASVAEGRGDRRGLQEAALEAERTEVAHDNATADYEATRDASERELEILRISLDKARRDNDLNS